MAKKAVVEELPRISLVEVSQCDGRETSEHYNEAWVAPTTGPILRATYTMSQVSPALFPPSPWTQVDQMGVDV